MRGGREAERFFDETEDYRKKWSDISEYGDPEGRVIGFDDDGRPIYEGGSIGQTQIQSEASRVFNPQGLTREELEGVGINPNRLGGFDPYEGFSGDIGNVGVWGAGGKLTEDEQNFYSKVTGSNLRGDVTTSTPNWFQDITQTPEGPMEYSQRGRGRGSTEYLDIPGRGSAELRYSKYLGIPLGKRTF